MEFPKIAFVKAKSERKISTSLCINHVDIVPYMWIICHIVFKNGMKYGRARVVIPHALHTPSTHNPIKDTPKFHKAYTLKGTVNIKGIILVVIWLKSWYIIIK